MGRNDVIILDSVLQQKKTQMASSLKEDDFFELFTFDQILRDFDLSYDEITSGKTGGGDDGGIDGFFIFVNGELVDEDTNIQFFKKNPMVELYLVQAKNTASFSESAFDRVNTTASDIFDLTKNIDALKSFYNASLISKVDLFRRIYLELASKHPRLTIRYFYASKGDIEEIHPKVRNRSKKFIETIKRFFTGSSTEVLFYGARQLLDASRIEKTYTLQLKFLENYLSRGEDNYIVLSGLVDYYEFVTDEDEKLRSYIFESNVRDYQGNVEVNKDIQNTLGLDDTLDFWWLNNGITILCTKATVTGKTITLDDVQIVNGLQTTRTIYNYLKEKKAQEKDRRRSILVRIIVITDEAARDRIIKATNFQTSIPVASLRATDRIQRDIEDYLLKHNYFYDRRKNYYKNIGKPVDKIISIPYLAQAIMAIVLLEPDNARARPSSLIKRDADYERVFDESFNPAIFLFSAQVMKFVDAVLRYEADEYSIQEKSNLKFHVATILVLKWLEKRSFTAKDIEKSKKPKLTIELVKDSLKETVSLARKYAKDQAELIEKVSKSRDFVKYLIKNVDVGKG